MKKIILSLFVLSFVLTGTAFAQIGMMGGYWQNGNTIAQPADSTNLNAALQDIYKSQNISNQNQINCAKVTDDQFEKLGDAYMGYGITEQKHTAMENMMGGEGSASLRQAHINMGRSYLSCWANYNSGPVYMPMMSYLSNNTTNSGAGVSGFTTVNPYYGNPGSYNMMNRNFGYGWNMMGGWYGGYGWLGWFILILVCALLILGIIAVSKWLRKSK